MNIHVEKRWLRLMALCVAAVTVSCSASDRTPPGLLAPLDVSGDMGAGAPGGGDTPGRPRSSSSGKRSVDSSEDLSAAMMKSFLSSGVDSLVTRDCSAHYGDSCGFARFLISKDYADAYTEAKGQAAVSALGHDLNGSFPGVSMVMTACVTPWSGMPDVRMRVTQLVTHTIHAYAALLAGHQDDAGKSLEYVRANLRTTGQVHARPLPDGDHRIAPAAIHHAPYLMVKFVNAMQASFIASTSLYLDKVRFWSCVSELDPAAIGDDLIRSAAASTFTGKQFGIYTLMVIYLTDRLARYKVRFEQAMRSFMDSGGFSPEFAIASAAEVDRKSVV